MAASQTHWQITGDHFDNCNYAVVCPCVLSPGGYLSAPPTHGFCEVALAFHIDQGRYGDVTLDGLNAVVMGRSPGKMSDANWWVAVYLDERADERQREALQAIFTGAADGPIGGLAPLISTVLGVKTVPITYRKEGKHRSVEVPGVMRVAVHATPGIDPEQEIWLTNAHPFAPQGVAVAAGEQGSVWADYGMRWDSSGKHGMYMPISWSNS
jgi:hypothetical protein